MVKKKRMKKKEKESSVKSYVIAFIPALLLVGFLVYVITLPPQPIATTNTTSPNTSKGNKAPDFTLEIINENGLTGKKFQFSDFLGSVIFMDFAFEWCPHCNNMAPKIEKLYEEYSKRGVKFLTIMGSSGTNAAKSAEFIKKHGITWTVLFDANMDVFNLYGVKGTPTYFVIDEDGKILNVLIGEQEYTRLSTILENALAS